MNKGFTLCREELRPDPGNLTHARRAVEDPDDEDRRVDGAPVRLCSSKPWPAACEGAETIDAAVFGRMLWPRREAIEKISPAKPGDKTLMDVLVPAEEAYQAALEAGEPFRACLDAMAEAAGQGRDATKDMVAKLGRSSRLGERSRGVMDAGAASCCLILQTMATSIGGLLSWRE